MAKPTPTQNPAAKKPDVKEVTEKKTKAKHPLVGSANKEVYPFTAVPADYTTEKFQSLKKKDFVDGSGAFFEYRAVLCEEQAKKFRNKAVEERTVGAGNKEDQKGIKKLMREAARLKELIAILGAKGIDTASIIAKAEATVKDTAGKAAEAAA